MVKPQFQELYFLTIYYETFQAHTNVKKIDNKPLCTIACLK